MGYDAGTPTWPVARWVREERLTEAEDRIAELEGALREIDEKGTAGWGSDVLVALARHALKKDRALATEQPGESG